MLEEEEAGVMRNAMTTRAPCGANNVKLLHICNFVRFLQNLYVCQILAKFASMSDSSAFFHLRVVPTLTESLSIEVYTLFACNTTK